MKKKIFFCAIGPEELWYPRTLIENLRGDGFNVETGDHPEVLKNTQADMVILFGNGQTDFDLEMSNLIRSSPRTQIIYLHTLGLIGPVSQHESEKVKFLICPVSWRELRRNVHASLNIK